MKSAVSFDATCPLSLRSIFSPSVQSAQRELSGAIASASEPSGVMSEKDSGEATSGCAPWPPDEPVPEPEPPPAPAPSDGGEAQSPWRFR